jgi:glycosyltransferase involved in cell wall biosynthesis
MKLAFINIYQNLVDRGAETFVKEVSERLSKKHEVKIFSGGKIPPARWPILWRLFIDPHGLAVAWFTLKLIPRILKGKYDVVIPLNGGWQVAIVRIVTWLNSSKMIISGQSGIGWDDRNNLWCFPNVFVALTDFQKKWARAANRFVKIAKIPNGVDLKKFSADIKPLDINLPKPIILCAAAFDLWKRLPLAIKAVSRLKNGSLLLAGKGEEENRLKKMCQKLLPGRFAISSFPHSEMPKVFTACDLFTYPTSPWESFGIVMAEAMASGLSVVATKDPIRKEIVGNAGILVDPMDTNAYAQALKKALETKWESKPREQAKKFDWDIITGKYEELFELLKK